MALLDGIDQIDWGALQHAYGSAADVPELLRALAEPDAATAQLKARASAAKRTVFDQVTWELWGNVFHQGTVYEASPSAIPFLIEILRDGPPRHDLRRFLLTYLGNLAVGYPDDLFPGVVEDDDEDEEGTSWRRNCHVSVGRSIADVVPFVDDLDTETALEAMAVVTWFPREAERIMPALIRIASSRSGLRAGTAIAAAAHLHAAGSVAVATRLMASSDLVLRLHAACATVMCGAIEAAGPAATILTEPIGDIARMRSPLTGTVGELVGRCVTQLPPAHREDAVDVLIRQLIGANPLVGLSIAGSMLQLIFREGAAPASATLLTSHQKRALLALADHGPFKVADGHFANFGLLLRRYGLPSTREAFVRWLET